MNKLILVPLAFVISCYPNPVCQSSRMTGNYTFTTTEISGNCGEMGRGEVALKDGIMDELACSVETNKFSTDSCVQETVRRCVNQGWVVETNEQIKAVDFGGKNLKGVVRATIKNTDKYIFCESTYLVDLVRK